MIFHPWELLMTFHFFPSIGGLYLSILCTVSSCLLRTMGGLQTHGISTHLGRHSGACASSPGSHHLDREIPRGAELHHPSPGHPTPTNQPAINRQSTSDPWKSLAKTHSVWPERPQWCTHLFDLSVVVISSHQLEGHFFYSNSNCCNPISIIPYTLT